MRITTMSRYGVRAVFDIVYNSAGMPVKIKDISRRQEIPQGYLEQIFMRLKKAEIVKSIRGPSGGYVLVKDQNKTTIGDVIRAVGENIQPVFCIDPETEQGTKCNRAGKCVTKAVWKKCGEILEEFFDSVTINDLSEKARKMGIKKDLEQLLDYVI